MNLNEKGNKLLIGRKPKNEKKSDQNQQPQQYILDLQNSSVSREQSLIFTKNSQFFFRQFEKSKPQMSFIVMPDQTYQINQNQIIFTQDFEIFINQMNPIIKLNNYKQQTLNIFSPSSAELDVDDTKYLSDFGNTPSIHSDKDLAKIQLTFQKRQKNNNDKNEKDIITKEIEFSLSKTQSCLLGSGQHNDIIIDYLYDRFIEITYNSEHQVWLIKTQENYEQQNQFPQLYVKLSDQLLKFRKSSSMKFINGMLISLEDLTFSIQIQ